MDSPKSDKPDSPPDASAPTAGLLGAVAGLAGQPLAWLLVALPVAAALAWLRAGELGIFIASAVAIIPLAGILGRATENLAETLGPGVGALLNATFGNAAELIIALFAIRAGPEMYPLVKASITGSIIGNILLVLGAAFLCGGLKHKRQRFNSTAAGMGATLLTLASIGLLMPSLYYYIFRAGSELTKQELANIESLSEEIAVILAVIYVLSLVFSLHTHRHLFAGQTEAAARPGHGPEWSRTAAVTLLLLSTAGIAWMSELLVGSVEHAGQALGMNSVFVGVIVVAMIGNAAEHSTAVLMALKNKMDLAVQIAVGSGIQIALFVAPVLVFASMLTGHAQPLDLHFTAMELVTVILAVLVLAMVSFDGEANWMEGVMLLGVYAIMALAFYHLPESVALR